MRGTKLWQSAGSPIIQGRSRTQRPFVQDWLAALGSTVVVVVLLDAAAPWPSQPLVALRDAVATAGLVALAAGAVACAIGVWISRKSHLGRPWRTGLAFGVVLVLVVMWLTGGIA